MSRQPAYMSQGRGQDAIWIGIRTLACFTTPELYLWLSKKGTSVHTMTISSYLKRLQLGGYLSVEKAEKKGQPNTWTLIKNTGTETPRLNKEGQPVTQGRGRENLWRTIKVLGEFSYRELAAAANTDSVKVEERDAAEYCRYLTNAGYLRITKAAHNGGGLTRYRLIPGKNTGPRPPQIQRTKQIYDPNLGLVVWSSHPTKSTESEAN
ncbi:hypothetical protein [Oceanobacter sp. 4_MG-2023]|uniref:hypothetical protein n=1 Tax=Oceanobacter sp. 4_MG-2023 TaxID=3062623 RepID=UPI002736C2A3|nr:hypothetical protein [Oceanobacter sp. 4_MG-2023]MDP2549459.1 hypothetical protein [Oceanobacter sp. 4_MG-2023]